MCSRIHVFETRVSERRQICQLKLKLGFNQTASSYFWLSVKDEYPMLSQWQWKFYCRLPLPTCVWRLTSRMRGLQTPKKESFFQYNLQKKKASFICQYNNESYLKYGFISTGANDRSLKCIFRTTTLPMFWMKVLPEYRDLAIEALKTLLPFPTSYLCESGFSVMAETKTKPQNRLDVRGTLRMSLSSIIPRWERLVAAKPAQDSH